MFYEIFQIYFYYLLLIFLYSTTNKGEIKCVQTNKNKLNVDTVTKTTILQKTLLSASY